MAPEPQPPPSEGPEEQGVLGSLPRTRPGVASPRRARARAARGDQAGAPQPASAESPSAAEELARAGVDLAAGAAAAGLRLAGRAAGELGRILGRG